MKQVAQRPRDGRVPVVDVPPPHVRPGWVLVRNRFSLISAGTERGKIELGRKRLLEKARARPDLVRKTVERARTDGIASTISVVRDRLAGLDPLGYSSAGIVEAVGERVEGLRPGDRVACGGAGWANHAGLVLVPKHLVAAVPETVDSRRPPSPPSARSRCTACARARLGWASVSASSGSAWWGSWCSGSCWPPAVRRSASTATRRRPTSAPAPGPQPGCATSPDWNDRSSPQPMEPASTR